METVYVQWRDDISTVEDGTSVVEAAECSKEIALSAIRSAQCGGGVT